MEGLNRLAPVLLVAALASASACAGLIGADFGDYKVATCSDGIQDGDETGVDCGGTCPRACGTGQACKTIADCQDGQGCAFYTFGDRRKQTHEEEYFGRLRRAFTEIRKVVAKGAVVVQLVGFGKPQEHLACYLEAMREAGFEEYDFKREGHRPGQNAFWRSVPHRKWYTWLRPEAKQAAEVLLVHRASGKSPSS